MDEKTDKNKTPAETDASSPASDGSDTSVVAGAENTGDPESAAVKAEASDAAADSGGQPAPESVPAPEPAQPTPVPSPQSHPVSHQADRPASPRGLLALTLLLALGALALAGWLYLQQQSRVGQQVALQDRLEAEAARIRATAEDARRSIDDAVQATRRTNTELRVLMDDERSRQARELAEHREAVETVEAALQSQRQQIWEMRSTDRVDWSLAEVEYLLRLAFQRLLMAKDVASAIALLDSADAILRELDDAALFPAREAIARDLAALRAVPDTDVEGTWLRLQALTERVDSLLLFELGIDHAPVTEVAEDAGWQERLRQGFRAALAKISSYIVIRRREQSFETLIDPQWEQLVRQNLRMQITQAQAALLSGNPRLYEASLTSTRRWLREFFDFNQADVAALESELDALMAVQITREYPDIGESLAAVRSAIDARHAIADGG